MSVAQSLTDPTEGGGAILASAEWTRALLTGTPAAIVATIAIASIGFLMLAGRLPLRRAALAITGCFIVFGAATIAGELVRLVQFSAESDEPGEVGEVAIGDAPAATTSMPDQPEVYDPYAGASVPIR